ncbi:GNAT family N-acetyltransferase [Agrococcus sp. KRD186]|uniref:GNAT family N-acetyltransferase n=1 Tax=Agrococcus sp. KRD186 TaxID=2729730 RepID=UPI0019D2270E
MAFRELRPEDLDRAASWLVDGGFRADRWRDDHTRSAVASDAGRVIAAGMIWTSRVHGDRYWVRIIVEPDRRRQGHGRAMLAHLSTLRPAELPFMARGFFDSDEMAFADGLGAHTIQVVPPARIATSSRTRLRALDSVVSAGGLTRATIEAANAETYEWVHAAWSPVGPGFESALNEDLWDELDPQATSVALDADGRILAMAMGYQDSSPPVVTAETVRIDQEGGERLVEACIRRTLDVYAERGVDEVEFDGHVTDPHFMPIWARLQPAGEWFRLVEVPAS